MRATKKHIGSWCDFEMSKKKVFQTNFDSHGIKMNFIMRLPLFPSIISKLQCPSYVIVILHILHIIYKVVLKVIDGRKRYLGFSMN